MFRSMIDIVREMKMTLELNGFQELERVAKSEINHRLHAELSIYQPELLKSDREEVAKTIKMTQLTP